MARRIRKTILGKKLGMSQMFDDSGNWVPVTLIEAGPCTVLQVKNNDNDGYEAVQIGFDPTHKDPDKPMGGHFDKVGVQAQRYVQEIPPIEGQDVEPGQAIDLSIFEGVEMVDVQGTSKGKGFAGTGEQAASQLNEESSHSGERTLPIPQSNRIANSTRPSG